MDTLANYPGGLTDVQPLGSAQLWRGVVKLETSLTLRELSINCVRKASPQLISPSHRFSSSALHSYHFLLSTAGSDQSPSAGPLDLDPQ